MYIVIKNDLCNTINYLHDDVYKYKIPNKKGFNIEDNNISFNSTFFIFIKLSFLHKHNNNII